MPYRVAVQHVLWQSWRLEDIVMRVSAQQTAPEPSWRELSRPPGLEESTSIPPPA